jgi:hypothetical protein
MICVKERKIDQENAHAEWNKTEGPTDILPQVKVRDFTQVCVFEKVKTTKKGRC